MSNFIKNNEHLFDMLVDGQSIWSYDVSVGTERFGDVTVYTCTQDELKITTRLRCIERFGAYEWSNTLENVGGADSRLITELWDCRCVLPFGHEEPYQFRAVYPDPAHATKIYAPTGSTWSAEEFFCDPDKLVGNRRINHIYPGEVRTYSASGGRSSEERAPFFNIHKDGEGVIMAVGWSGQWTSQIARGTDSLTLRSGIENLSFRLKPSEKIRTSSVVIMPYKGSVVESQNLWRRLVRAEYSIVGEQGRVAEAPFAASFWGGSSSGSMLRRIDAIKRNRLKYEYVWIDAGWYGSESHPSANEFEGDWGNYTGDWRVSPHTHPGMLRDVSRAVHDAGMKLLLWFEPERVVSSAPIVSEHPEYFLGSGGNRLLDLGNPDAREYIFELLSGIISDLSIDCYRQDFNISPLALWRENDAHDRQGITEIKHITGMYELWDRLLERFPRLIIDNCASGGRRIDIETLRRSIPLWRSDYYCPANFDVEVEQMHTLTFASWLPYSGAAIKSFDNYKIRSGYAPAASSMQFYYADSMPEDFEQQRKQCDEYLRVRPYFSEDFYPLTEPSPRGDIWSAAQYNRPSRNDGLIQVFRRDNSPYESVKFKLYGLDKTAEYRIYDLDSDVIAEYSGAELMERGLALTICERHSARLYIYRKI